MHTQDIDSMSGVHGRDPPGCDPLRHAFLLCARVVAPPSISPAPLLCCLAHCAASLDALRVSMAVEGESDGWTGVREAESSKSSDQRERLCGPTGPLQSRLLRLRAVQPQTTQLTNSSSSAHRQSTVSARHDAAACAHEWTTNIPAANRSRPTSTRRSQRQRPSVGPARRRALSSRCRITPYTHTTLREAMHTSAIDAL